MEKRQFVHIAIESTVYKVEKSTYDKFRKMYIEDDHKALDWIKQNSKIQLHLVNTYNY